MFDGKVPHWYHVQCFFARNRPKAVGDISHFDSLRWEDQEKIKTMVENCAKGVVPSSSKKGDAKAAAKAVSSRGTILKDFRLEYAKSGASKCGVCEEKIPKGEVRAGKKEYESQRAKMYGPYDRWHHIACFVEKREDLEYFDSGDAMAGFKTLSADDQASVKSKIKAVKRKSPKNGADEPDSKKIKVEENKEEKEALKKQMKKIFYYRDLLERQLKKVSRICTHDTIC